jgi:lipoate-protein ligase A
VPQGPGVSNIVLAFNAPRKFTIEDAYRLLVDVIVRGFGALGQNLRPGETPGSFCDGAWNLSLAGRKLVGTAQHWRPVRGQRPRVLAHAMILTDDPGPGAQAIAEMHRDLGLGPIAPEVHTSIRSAFQMADIPRAALLEAAKTALDALPNSNA